LSFLIDADSTSKTESKRIALKDAVVTGSPTLDSSDRGVELHSSAPIAKEFDIDKFLVGSERQVLNMRHCEITCSNGKISECEKCPFYDKQNRATSCFVELFSLCGSVFARDVLYDILFHGIDIELLYAV